jgi:hypothetical protein
MFPVPRFRKTTSNPIESMTSALKKFIGQDITSMIISINNYSMRIFNESRQNCFQSFIVDQCIKKLTKNVTQSLTVTNLASSSSIYLVDQNYIVNLETKSCDCREGYDIGYLVSIYAQCTETIILILSVLYPMYI